MQLKEIMSRDVHCVSPETTIRNAATTMKELDVGSLPVCTGDRLAGIVTDRDIVVRGLANGQGASATVMDVMTPDVAWCYDDVSTADAARLMQERQIRRLPVLNHDKRLVGIVSLGDLAVRTNDDRLSGQTLEQVSEPDH